MMDLIFFGIVDALHMIKDFAEYQSLQKNDKHLFKKRIHCLLTMFS